MELYIARECNVVQGNKFWELQRMDNGQIVTVEDSFVKQQMQRRKVDIANLTLTTDGRLVKSADYKMEAFKEMMFAPEQIRGVVKVVDKEIAEHLEACIDSEIAKALRIYSEKYRKYLEIKNTDSDKNMIIARFKVGVDTYLMLRYQKLIYGEVEDKIYFDVLIGIEAFSCGNENKHIKMMPHKASEHYSKIVTDRNHELSNELRSTSIGFVTLRKFNGRFAMDSNEEYLSFAKLFMEVIADQMDEVVLADPRFENNVDVANLVEYDTARKEYVKGKLGIAGVSVAGGVVLTALAATAVATNPEIIQTGLFAKLLNVGSTSQIIKSILGYSVAVGGVAGAGMMGVVHKKADTKGMFKRSKQRIEEYKPEVGKAFNDNRREERNREERMSMRERMIQQGH